MSDMTSYPRTIQVDLQIYCDNEGQSLCAEANYVAVRRHLQNGLLGLHNSGGQTDYGGC